MLVMNLEGGLQCHGQAELNALRVHPGAAQGGQYVWQCRHCMSNQQRLPGHSTGIHGSSVAAGSGLESKAGALYTSGKSRISHMACSTVAMRP